LLISALPEIFPHSDHVVAAPGPIRPQVGRAQVAVTSSEPAEKKMLSDPRFEAFAHIDSRTPCPLHADRVDRPCIERLRKISAKQELRLTKKEESLKLPPAERTDLYVSRKHVAGKGIARGVDAASHTRICPAKVRIYFIMWRGNIELRVSPEHVMRKKHAVRTFMRNHTFGRNILCRYDTG